MRVEIAPGRASGRLQVPPSKSVAHRLLICAGMSRGRSIIRGISSCEDVQATLDCLRAVGAECRQDGDTVEVQGVDLLSAHAAGLLPCRESGSTLRFLIPPLLLTGSSATFTACGRLPERPMTVYENICKEKKLHFCKENDRITVCGRLPSGRYELPGNVSSQFISGLLFALPQIEGDSEIVLTTAVESRSYLELTLDAMRQFGVKAEWADERRLHIPGGQTYRACDVTVEGDYSNAAFADAFNCLGGAVRLEGLRSDSLQGDRRYREMMAALSKGKPTLSLADCPDLGPILFAVAAAKHGGIFTETRRLSIKESDRVAAMREELAALGAELIAGEDTVEVLPAVLRAPTRPIKGHNDHRIVMSMAVLLTLVGGELKGAEAVRKSYPNFFADLAALGLRIKTFSEEGEKSL